MEIPFGMWAQMGPGNHVCVRVCVCVLDGGPDTPWQEVIIRLKGPVVKYSDTLL